MKEIKVIISKDGSGVELDVEGVKGSSCEDLTKDLLEALGSIEKSEKKPEYYQEEVSCISCNT